jgi:hypothetical protein
MKRFENQPPHLQGLTPERRSHRGTWRKTTHLLENPLHNARARAELCFASGFNYPLGIELPGY